MSLWLGERENREGRVPRSQRGITSGFDLRRTKQASVSIKSARNRRDLGPDFPTPAGLQRSRVRSVSEAATGEEFGLPHLPGPRR
jgi:hypothetical protein